MKRRIILTIGLILTVGLIALTVSDSNVGAQRNRVFRANAGMVYIGSNQKLQIAVSNESENATINVRFGSKHYHEEMCTTGGICKYSSGSQTISDPITISPGEATSMNLVGPGIWGSWAGITNPNVQVNAMIINTVTDEVTAVQIPLQLENR